MRIVIVKSRMKLRGNIYERLLFYSILGLPISLLIRIFT